jgi:hypothetical protein
LEENVKAVEIFYVSRELCFEVYKVISAQNKLTKHYRSVINKKSISSHMNFFLQLQMFSSDVSHRYEPSKLEPELAVKIGEYLT